MSKRLNQEREAVLQPKRMAHAKKVLERMGFDVEIVDHTQLIFSHNGHPVRLWPYSGWHTGRTVQDGRGLGHLVRQLEEDSRRVQ